MLDNLTDPEAILEDTWRRLMQASRDPVHGFRTPAVATTDREGVPTVRTVVLRMVDPVARVLCFQTDVRSAKFQMLVANPQVAWVFYDLAARLQVRIATRCSLHTSDDFAQQQWDSVPDMARLGYHEQTPPGREIPQVYRTPSQWMDVGRGHFCVVRCVADSLDWLLLHPAGHRRLGARWTDAGEQVLSWLAP